MQKVKKINKLKSYYDDLALNTPPIAKIFLEDVCEACAISVSTFYRKIKAPQCFNKAEQKAIADAAEKKVSELF